MEKSRVMMTTTTRMKSIERLNVFLLLRSFFIALLKDPVQEKLEVI